MCQRKPLIRSPQTASPILCDTEPPFCKWRIDPWQVCTTITTAINNHSPYDTSSQLTRTTAAHPFTLHPTPPLPPSPSLNMRTDLYGIIPPPPPPLNFRTRSVQYIISIPPYVLPSLSYYHASLINWHQGGGIYYARYNNTHTLHTHTHTYKYALIIDTLIDVDCVLTSPPLPPLPTPPSQ